MKVAIIGATGFVGRALVRHLLDVTDYDLVAFSRSAQTHYQGTATVRMTAFDGDVFNQQSLETAMKDCDAVVYLVHMMNAPGDYAVGEDKAANVFAAASKAAGVKRVVFVGGLGDPTGELSKHLASRQHTGQILRATLPLVIELRASMIIGDGSTAYEIIKTIVRKLPVLVVPRWAVTPTQPITLHDALLYITASLRVAVNQHAIIGIGGPEILSYRQVVSRYAAWAGLRRRVFAIPGVPRIAAVWWLRNFLPSKSGTIGKAMVDSLHYPMVVTDTRAAELFPDIAPQRIERGFTAR